MSRVLFVLLFAVPALAEQPLPVYPGTTHTRIGNDLVIAGEFYRMGYFLTADSPKTVARYFEAEWKRDGYPVTIDGTFVDEGIISALAPSSIASRAALAVRSKSTSGT